MIDDNDRVCLPFCPTGFTENSTHRVCEGPLGLNFSVTFDNILVQTWTDSINNVELVGGGGNESPTIRYQRGAYFNGESYLESGFWAIPF